MKIRKNQRETNSIKFDTKSLRFKLWAYFALFAILLVVILWFLQIIFLQTFYKEMKGRQIIDVADTLSAKYGKSLELNLPEVIDEVSRISYENDMYIHMEFPGGITLTPNSDYPRRSGYMDFQDLALIKRQVAKSPSHTVSFTLTGPSGQEDTLVYGRLMTDHQDKNTFLCIFAPLTPVDSTVAILGNQLIYVTLISLILAFLLSVWLSRRITRPLVHIKNSAAQLAKGNYDVAFDGGHYSEIIALADTLTYTSEELAKADNLQKDLVANVSHDLRTPLTMVKSYAEMIRDISGNNPEKRNAHLQVIIDEADRLNTLVSDLLELSKMQSGVTAISPASFDIKEMVRSLLATYRILEEQEGYSLSFLCTPLEGPVFVTGDENRLKQVLSNLLTNAVRHGGSGKLIEVCLLSQDGTVKISVRDQGPGIEKKELDHIWERYYRASKSGSRAPSGGSGLGLSIVKEILVLHNANFGVDSLPGVGSTFWFTLKTDLDPVS